MTIRKMVISDYDKVYSLWLSCKGMGLNDLDDSRDGIQKYLDRNPETCFVAEDGEDIIGVIIAGHDGRRGYIYHTAVSPEHRGQDIGTKLVDTAMNALNEQGINKVALVCFSKNDGGNTFWEKTGFTHRTDLCYRNKALSDMKRIDT
ncbi:MAG: GNAT family N-acetyltransferase [Ruminococcus sp.]|uniref:GNAT family N-acetyltransferase n=1 Tax=Ruminococcus sp. TaxID=41978 RepID=UPI0025DC5011|nr:GNAT family N-acetyltransferase [Ruminococcus sp.]MBO4867059.1 GNAT family N-acetyltransferase [Ruminococcus sp.]